MVTPIASPQNAIAFDLLNPSVSWLSWLSLTIPLSVISNFLCWGLLIFIYKPHKCTPRVQPIRATSEAISRTQIYIIAVTLITIILWCCESQIKSVFGNSGVIALFPLIAFFATGILDKDDFNSFLWTVVMLAMGGSALGTAVKNSTLLDTIASGIGHVLEGQSLWIVLTTFCLLTLVAATFISHTVSALIILPIVKSVGESLPGDHANLLVVGAGMMCSAAMGLSVSGFPNIFAVSIEDATGAAYVSSKDFLRVGVPMSLMVMVLTVTLGYGILLALGM
jgi:phosphate transporter